MNRKDSCYKKIGGYILYLLICPFAAFRGQLFGLDTAVNIIKEKTIVMKRLIISCLLFGVFNLVLAQDYHYTIGDKRIDVFKLL